MKPSRLRIIVTGLIAQHPMLGGVTWDYIQYVIGLANLGHDVYYMEDSGEWPYVMDSKADPVAYDCSLNIQHISGVMSRFGFQDRWAYHFPVEPKWFGMQDAKRKEIIRTADLLINVSGTLQFPEHYREIPKLVYIDSDPVFTQIKCLQNEKTHRKGIDVHDVHFSFGELIMSAGPQTGHRWLPTRSPIVISEWSKPIRARDVFTTVMNWASYAPVLYQNESYSQKDTEFKKFLDLPSKSDPAKFEIAMPDIRHKSWETRSESLPEDAQQLVSEHPDWTPYDLLTHKGWTLADSLKVCPDPDKYREYVCASKAEWSVAKNGYVKGKSGWFSCRSSCYLAAGRPVVVQDTGFSKIIPTGRGLLSFKTMDEAVIAVREVEGDYEAHAKAARDLAVHFFDAGKILSSLIERAYGTVPIL